MKRVVHLLLVLCITTSATSSGSSETDSLLAELKNAGNDTTRINLLNAISNSYENSAPDKAFEYSSKALELSRNNRFKKGEADALSNLAWYSFTTNDYLKSESDFKAALDIFRQTGDKKGVCKTLCNLGIVYQFRYDYNQSLECYLKALDLVKTLEDENQLAIIHGNLGNLYDLMGDYTKALDHYSLAEDYFLKVNDSSMLATVIGNVGLVLHNENQHSESIKKFQEAILLDSLMGNKVASADNYGNLGLVYGDLKEYKKAESAFKTAVKLDEEINNRNGLAFDLSGLSALYLKMSNDSSSNTEGFFISRNRTQLLEQALDLGLRAQEIYSDINSKSYSNYKTLAEIYKELGNSEKAFEYINLFWEGKNEVMSAEKAREFTQIEEKKQRELDQHKIDLLEAEQKIANLTIYLYTLAFVLLLVAGLYLYHELKSKKKINAKLENLNEKLKAANDAKDKFFSIIAHDLINPISGLSSALGIYQREYDELSEEERQEYIDALVKSSKRASELLNNLLSWSKVQRGNMKFNPQVTELNTLVKSAIELVKNQAKTKQIDINFDAENSVEAEIDRNMINSVLSNLLTNAIKFSPRQSEVKVSLKSEERNAVLIVKDQGVGMQRSQVDSLFSIAEHETSLGTDNEKGTGLGLILCKDFIEMHGGLLHIQSEPQKGTEIQVKLPQ